jgi:hypothetical protein
MQRAREGAFESGSADAGPSFAAGADACPERDVEAPVVLAQALGWARATTSAHPYAVLGGAALLGSVLAAGPLLAARAIAVVAAFAVRAAVRGAADQLSREAARFFESSPPEREDDPEPLG